MFILNKGVKSLSYGCLHQILHPHYFQSKILKSVKKFKSFQSYSFFLGMLVNVCPFYPIFMLSKLRFSQIMSKIEAAVLAGQRWEWNLLRKWFWIKNIFQFFWLIEIFLAKAFDQRHLITHTKVKSQAISSNLKRHLKRFHQRIRPHVCSESGKCFFLNQHLEEHSITHTGEKSFACDLFKKSFGQLGQLKRHLMTVH